MRHLWLLPFSVTLFGGCTTDQEPLRDVQIGRELRAWTAGLEPDGAPLLGQPLRILRWRDSLVILDLNPKQVVLLDRDLSGGRAFGREGEGPGELAAPYRGIVRRDELWVYDIGNARISRFLPDGRLAGEIPLPRVVQGGFVPLSDTSLLLPEARGEYYLSTYMHGGTVKTSVPRVAEEGIGSVNQRDRRRIPSPVFLSGGAGDYVIVDSEQGLVLRNGGREIIPIPAEIALELQARVDSAMQLYLGGARVAVSKITSVRTDDAETLLWLFGEEDLAGLILSRQGSWKRLSGLSSIGTTVVRDVMLWDDELFVLTEEGVRVFALIRQQIGDE